MTPLMQALYGIAILLVGSVKTWLHMSIVPVLSLPMCSGKTIMIGTSPVGFLEQAHCWGCYAVLPGISLLIMAGYSAFKQRRSVAENTD